MNEEVALLAAIRAEPDDDTRRLAYADFLDERASPGDSVRAEFIRVQMASMGSHSQSQWIDLVARQRSLLRNHWEAWVPELKPNRGYTFKFEGVAELVVLDGDGIRASAQFSRGFVGKLTCAAGDWLTHGDAICSRHPVTRVRLTDFPRFIHGKTGLLFVDDVKHRPVNPKALPDADTPPEAFRDPLVIARQAGHMLAHHWPGVTFELPSTAVQPLSSFAAITVTNLGAAAQQAYAAFAPIAQQLGDNLAAALLASGAFQNGNAEEPNEAE